jgi:hypothetical protein
VILLPKKIQQQNPSGFGGREIFRYPPGPSFNLVTLFCNPMEIFGMIPDDRGV